MLLQVAGRGVLTKIQVQTAARFKVLKQLLDFFSHETVHFWYSNKLEPAIARLPHCSFVDACHSSEKLETVETTFINSKRNLTCQMLQKKMHRTSYIYCIVKKCA